MGHSLAQSALHKGFKRNGIGALDLPGWCAQVFAIESECTVPDSEHSLAVSCEPVAKNRLAERLPPGAKARLILLALSARLKSRPDTKPPRLTAKMSFSARRGE